MIVFAVVDKHPFAFFLASTAFAISLVLVIIQQVSDKPAEKPTIKATYVQIDTVYTVTKENVDNQKKLDNAIEEQIELSESANAVAEILTIPTATGKIIHAPVRRYPS